MDDTDLIRRALDSLREVWASVGVVSDFRPLPPRQERRYRPDGHVTLSVGEARLDFAVEIKRQLNKADAAWIAAQVEDEPSWLLVSERVTASVATVLREHGVNYLDAAGNSHIERAPFFVHVDGRKPVLGVKRDPVRAFSGEGLKVVFVLLLDPVLASEPYRTLARLSGVSLGVVQYTVKDLERSGYMARLGRTRRRVTDVSGLLDRWAEGYAEALRPKISAGQFAFTSRSDTEAVRDWGSITIPETDFWGGEPAAALVTGHLKPAHLTIYTRQDRAALMKWIRAVPSPHGPLTVLNTFWPLKTEGEIPGAFGGASVPDVVVYADLLATDDPRNAEVAALLRERILSGLGRG